MSHFNKKQFLQIFYPNENTNEISIIFLDLNLNKVQKTSPSLNQIIYNLNGYPKQWMILKKGKQTTFSLENSQHTDTIVIEFIDTTKGEKTKITNKEDKEKIDSATKIIARTPPKKTYNFNMMKNLAEIMENFILSKNYQKYLDEYLYPEINNPNTSQKNTTQKLPEKDLQNERPLHISDLFTSN